MLKIQHHGFKSRIFIGILVFTFGFGNIANAETLNAVSHIHQLKVFKNQVLIGTHEGLFRLAGVNNMIRISKEKFDIMGLAILGDSILASGHPTIGSKLKSPVGLIESKDGGINWKVISLAGKVDFHSVEAAGTDVYGTDSQNSDLLHSTDSGKIWKSLGSNTFADIAVSSDKSGMAIALKGTDLLFTKNAFKSISKLNNSEKFSQIEWINSGLYGLSGSSLFKSIDTGKSWTKISTFNGEVGILSANDECILVTVGSNIFKSNNAGKSFKKVS